ncbi:Chondramide synthase cmdD [Nymphon striatum]|nr:Chondramide synthase cmdD [Nymphon striatum]
MEAKGVQSVTPRLRSDEHDMSPRPWIENDNFSAGYLQRRMHLLPRQGDREPWIMSQDYFKDRETLPLADLDDGTLQEEKLLTTAPRVQPPRFFPTRWIEDFLISFDPDTTKSYHDYLTVRWAVRIMPGISPRTLRRAFDNLVARHEPLRLRFVQTNGGWKSEVLAEHPLGLIVEDFGAMSKDEQQAIVTERVRRPLTALSDALFEMRLLRFERSGDVLMMRANHAIIDGFSVGLLIEELLKHIVGVPVGPPPLSYGEFVAFQQKKARDLSGARAQISGMTCCCRRHRN